MNQEFITKSAEETEMLGEEFSKKLNPQDVVFLVGDLGSGKTTFVKGLARGLGIESRILSPTFVVVRQHSVRSQKTAGNSKQMIEKLYHLDLYRLGNEDEAKGVDLNDFLLDEKGIVVIEWPVISQDLVHKKVWKIQFEYREEGRKIAIRHE